MGIATKVIVFLSSLVFSACSSVSFHSDSNNESTPFAIALIGDFPYTEAKLIEADNLMADLDAHKELSFIIHDGDIKGGNVPCENSIYYDRLATFNKSTHPLFYIFGDNEWTDCHREAAGRYDPYERLGLLRGLFADFSNLSSLGAYKLPLERQNKIFPENIRWFKNNVMFVGLHMPGSNNGLMTDPHYLERAKVEYQLRNQANLEFLKRSFELAKERQCPGIMITIQANPWDLIPATRLTGFEDFVVLLERKTREFGKPVVLVNGDSHYFRIDKPMPAKLPSEVIGSDFPFVIPSESNELRLENFTRVETFGNPNTHWVKATIDVNNPNVFSFEPMMVEKNRVVH